MLEWLSVSMPPISSPSQPFPHVHLSVYFSLLLKFQEGRHSGDHFHSCISILKQSVQNMFVE